MTQVSSLILDSGEPDHLRPSGASSARLESILSPFAGRLSPFQFPLTPSAFSPRCAPRHFRLTQLQLQTSMFDSAPRSPHPVARICWFRRHRLVSGAFLTSLDFVRHDSVCLQSISHCAYRCARQYIWSMHPRGL